MNAADGLTGLQVNPRILLGKPCRARRPRILALGLGNLLLRDDGIGVHAVRRLKVEAPRGVFAVDVGTNIFSALHLLEKADKVIAFDALLNYHRAGSVYLLDGEEVADAAHVDSLHQLGLMSFIQSIRQPRPDVVVIAAEPEDIDWGMELSAPLQSAVPRMVQAALALIACWRSGENDWRKASL